MPRITVCKNCEERTIGCHSNCEKYLAEKATEQQAIDDYKDRNRGNYQLKQIYSERKVKKMRRYGSDIW